MKVILIASLLLLSFNSYAKLTEYQACYKYQRADLSWSTAYKVTGLKGSGSEFYELTKNSKFLSHNDYFVIPWKNGGYSSIRLQLDEVPTYETELEANNGLRVRLKEGWDFCN